MKPPSDFSSRWRLVDQIILLYVGITGILILLALPWQPEGERSSLGGLILLRLGILAGLWLLPPRGSAWEDFPPLESGLGRLLRKFLRFLRHSYPLLLILVFFEEVAVTVNILSPQHPYWFEPYLYAADRTLLGELPALLLADFTQPWLVESMHAFYFSYYLILIGGVVAVWRDPGQSQAQARGGSRGAFESTITGMTLAYLLTFLFYPFLPARGPWENLSLMEGLPPLEGPLFTPLVHWVISQGAVSGGCFPSSHVSGAWGLIAGMAPHRTRLALLLAGAAAGMSLACVYTRYHHAVDILAGLPIGLLAGWWGGRLATRRFR